MRVLEMCEHFDESMQYHKVLVKSRHCSRQRKLFLPMLESGHCHANINNDELSRHIYTVTLKRVYEMLSPIIWRICYEIEGLYSNIASDKVHEKRETL